MTDYKALVTRGHEYANQLADSTHIQHKGAELVGDLADAVEALERRAVHAELEWSEASARAEALVPQTVTLAYHDSIVGEANRQIHVLERRVWALEAERDEALQALAESRARYGDLEARARAFLEAFDDGYVSAKVKAELREVLR